MDINFEKQPQKNIKTLTADELAMLLKKFNGRNEMDESKVILAYQSFDFAEPDESLNKNTSYSCTNASVEITYNSVYSGFYTVDIIFHSAEDPELKLLWGRLQKHKQNMSMEANKDWIFYIQLLEKASVTQQTVENDILWTCNIFNPELFFLTREVPNLLCQEVKIDNGLYGGNIIRMLVPVPLLTFDKIDNFDTQSIKNDVLTEDVNHAYLNSAEDTY